MAKNKATQVVTEPKEVEAAYTAIEAFFDSWDISAGHFLNSILEAALARRPAKGNPSNILFFFKTLRQLVHALLVIKQSGYKRSAAILSIPENGVPDLVRHDDYQGPYASNMWEALPRGLSAKEYFNPYVAIKKLARYANAEQWDRILDDLQDYTFYQASFAECGDGYNVMTIQRILTKAIEASYLVFVRTRPTDGIEKPADE